MHKKPKTRVIFTVILSLVRDHNRFAYLDKGKESKRIENRNAKSVAHIFKVTNCKYFTESCAVDAFFFL